MVPLDINHKAFIWQRVLPKDCLEKKRHGDNENGMSRWKGSPRQGVCAQLCCTVHIAVRKSFVTGNLKYSLFSPILIILKSSEQCLSCQDFTNLTQCHQESPENHGKAAVHCQPNCLSLGYSPMAWPGHRNLSQLEGTQGAQRLLSPSFNTSLIFTGLVSENPSSQHSFWASQRASIFP